MGLNRLLGTWTLRHKLVAIIFLASAVATLAGLGVYLARDLQQQRASLHNDALLIARTVAGYSAADLAFRDPVAARATLEGLRAVPHVANAFLFDSRGRLFARLAAHPQPPAALAPETRQASHDDRYLHVAEPVAHAGKVYGSLHLLVSTAPLRQGVRDAALSLAVIFAAALLLSLVLALRLQRLISRPILDLAAEARRIAEQEDYTGRLVPPAADEIGSLYLAFNTMLARIEARRADRDRALAALGESEQRYRLLVEQAPEAIVVLDVDSGRFIDVNENATRLFAVPRDRLLQLGPVALSPPNQPDGRPSAEAALEKIGQALAGETVVFEWLHHAAAGQDIPCEVRLARLPAEGRRLLRGSITDISGRKRAEAMLLRHNRLLRSIASVNELLMRDQDEHRLMQEVCRILVEENPYCMAWIGRVDAAGARVRPVAEAGVDAGYLANADIRCDASPHGQGPTGTAIRSGQTVINEDSEHNERFAPWRDSARQQGYRSSASTPLRVDGAIIGAINVYSTTPHAFATDDVVLLEKLAADLGQALGRLAAAAALRESEARIRLLLESTAEGIYGVDTQGLCSFINPAALRMLGYDREGELIGRSLHELIHHTYPDGRHYPKEACRVGLAVREGLRIHADDEVHWRRDGSSFPVEYWSHPMYRDGQQLGAVVTFVDISERKRTEARIHALNQELEQRVQARTAQLRDANQELEAFSYSVSHDLRSPLRAIDGFAQALAEDCGARLDDTGRNYLRRLRAGAQRMDQLINDLLKLSRVSRAPLQPERVFLTPLAQEVINALREAEPERQADVILQGGLVARCDRGLMRVALENLLGNAWKYTAKRPQARIEMGSLVRDGQTVYYVRDNGAGFDMKYADKLFGAFQRLHHPNEFPGSGIGLATVRRIVQRHGGRIWAEALPEAGATFYFTLGEGGDGATE